MWRLAPECALALAIAAAMAILFGVSDTLTIDYFDAYEYLANARVLAGESSGELEYLWRRPPLVPLLNALGFPAGAGLEAGLRALARMHVLAWGLSLASLGLAWLHFGRFVRRPLALLGVFLLLANPIFLHLVPFGLVDVPALLFTLGALHAALRCSEGGRLAAPALAIALAAAMATKYNLLLLPIVLSLFAPLGSGAADASPIDRLRRARIVPALVAGGLLWYLAHLGIHWRLEGLSLAALSGVIRTLAGEVGVVSAVIWDDPAWEYLQEIWQVTPVLLLAACVAGLARAWRPGDDAARLHALWLLAFVAVMSLAVGSKSSRYLLPALPSLVFLQLRGLEWMIDRGRERLAPGWPRNAALAVGAVLTIATPLRLGIAQLRHFEDPVYRTGFLAEVGGAVAEDPARPIFWRHEFFTLTPAERVFFPHDETFYFHHLGPTSLAALLDRRVSRWPAALEPSPRTLVQQVTAGFWLVESHEELHLTHHAARMPETLPPLGLVRVDRERVSPPAKLPDAAAGWLFFSPPPDALALSNESATARVASREVEAVRIERREFAP